MTPEPFRIRKGFAGRKTAFTACLSATTALVPPAFAAPASMSQITDIAPIVIALGALGFGLLASALVRRTHVRRIEAESDAQQRLAQIRSELDLASGILDGMRELTLIWRDANDSPAVYGQTELVLRANADPTDVIDFRRWLTPSDGAILARQVVGLKTDGRTFETSMVTLSGQLMRLSGRLVCGAAVLRVRPATAQPDAPVVTSGFSGQNSASTIEQIFDVMGDPAWHRNQDGMLIYANAAYWRLAGLLGKDARAGEPPEIFSAAQILRQKDAIGGRDNPVTLDNLLLGNAPYDLVMMPIETGTAGFLRPRPTAAKKPSAELPPVEPEIFDGSGVINAIAVPIAVFDAARKLRHYNQAYADFWGLDSAWLATAPGEGAVLDELRRQGRLPSEVDYRAWRAQHLASYSLGTQRAEPWYLPDGQVINVIAVPGGQQGGVIYIFENITEQLALESRYNALIGVQTETLSALSEGVAVFGTNGRLTLHNPRLSTLWKLPMNELGLHPHIDDIARACARGLPEDGGRIWAELKKDVINLNPARTDRSARLTRADGSLIDYTVTRLPDGQTMMTFVDVTESASYQRVLKERNDALVTADRLKDAFVQNVSYELRSPLTNIIGFADLLASGTAGALNEKQQDYTRYIRASSETLGVLIDNILDLATVDAGIAELNLAEQDIPALIERVQTGLAGTLIAGGSEMPPNLVVEIAPDLPTFVADGTRIIQVLYNLLSNAVRFSDPGAEVRLSVSSRGGRIVFVVEDEGVGISDELKAAMFQRFEGRSSEGRQRGAGLGLAIVKTFVNLHGGTIALEQRQPCGTRVIVSVPAEAATVSGAAE